MNFLRENRKALRFLLFFIATYVVLNTVYGYFIQSYSPTSDPFTRLVSNQVSWILRLFDPTVAAFPSDFDQPIAIANELQNMIYVYEGCNGANVIFVYVSFLVAFSGSLKRTTVFAIGGSAVIYVMNIARIVLLYGVAFYFPSRLYFFHKYFFTGIIYAVVFLLWYLWVRNVRRHENQ